MVDMNDLLDVIGIGLATDTAIDTWSIANYDRECGVIENYDPHDLPQKENCPMIILAPMTKDTGLSNPKKDHVIGLSCAVSDPERPETVQGVIRYEGVRKAEELRKLALARVVAEIKAMSIGLILEKVGIEYDGLSFFPVVAANMTLEFKQRKIIGNGQNPYE